MIDGGSKFQVGGTVKGMAACVTLFLLAACKGGVIEAELIAQAKESAAGQIGIPSTATFRNIKLSDVDGADVLGTVCGEVSGKSEDGKDVGFNRFIYSPAIGDAIIAADLGGQDFGPEVEKRAAEFNAAFEAMWKESCA